MAASEVTLTAEDRRLLVAATLLASRTEFQNVVFEERRRTLIDMALGDADAIIARAAVDKSKTKG